MSDSRDFFSAMRKTIQSLETFALYAGMGWIIVMTILVTFDVAGRYFFSRPVPGAIEMSGFMLAVFGICGMAYAHRSGANVKVTMLTDLLPPMCARFAEAIAALVSFQIMAMLAWHGFVSGIEEFNVGTVTDRLGMPVYPIYFLLSFGAGLLCLEIVMETVESMRNFFSRRQIASSEQASPEHTQT